MYGSPGPTDCSRSTQNQKDGSVPRVMGPPESFAADGLSESSSSIGIPDDSEEDEEQGEEEGQSKFNPRLGLDSLDSLEESLPVKRGLSGHFHGKSRSFTDLSKVTSLKELQKKENPVNKRRRVQMASRWSRSFSWSNPRSMPLLPRHEEEEEECRTLEPPSSISSSSASSSSSSLTEERKQEDQTLVRRRQKTVAPESSTRLGLGSFKLRSFSPADLTELDDDEEEEDKKDA